MRHLAVYLYDQIITSRNQIDYIWSRRFSAMTAFFILLHLSTIATYLLYTVALTVSQCQVCISLLKPVIAELTVALAVCLVPRTRPDFTLLTVTHSL